MVDIVLCLIAVLIVMFIMVALGLIAHFAYRILTYDKIGIDDDDFPPY
jgi:hypothetical protein